LRGTHKGAAQGRRLEEDRGKAPPFLTDFERKVLAATTAIPRGQTRTYKQIAEAIGHPRAFRAVGSALRKNPYPITIPCHRVIRSDGKTGSYSGKGGEAEKKRLLLKEGALPGEQENRDYC
jgi:methylated-DNA-[protein]-cysteine S-methyltransferase